MRRSRGAAGFTAGMSLDGGAAARPEELPKFSRRPTRELTCRRPALSVPVSYCQNGRIFGPMSKAIVLFAKAPRPGRVKTRLVPDLSGKDAASLHDAFVRDMWERLWTVAPDSCFLYSDRSWPPYVELAGADRATLQRGGDLGAKLLHSFEELSAQGYERILIVGSDSPTLSADFLQRGLDMLASKDAVLGPTSDGGYYAVGCRVPKTEMFSQVTWSTPATLAHTERAFEGMGWSIERLPQWYDVDTIDDLRRLATDSDLHGYTRQWFLDHADLAVELGFEP